MVQDTGWSKILPAGEGCLAFNDVEGAAAALDAVESDYDRHAAAAYDFAREHLAPRPRHPAHARGVRGLSFL